MTDDIEEREDDDAPFEPIKTPLWRRGALILAVGSLGLLGLGLGLGFGLSQSAPSVAEGPEGVPLQQVPDLASVNTTLSGAPVDGITCRHTMQQRVKYHVHAHVAIFVDGHQERLPAGAGIAAPRFYEHLADGLFVDNDFRSCLYWLHVHANDGIIHVESPGRRSFTLGQFFDVWHQPLGVDEVGPARGTVVAFEDGKRVTGNPRDIPLLSQAVIQLDVGHPVVPFQPMQFKVKGLCGAGKFGCSGSSG